MTTKPRPRPLVSAAARQAPVAALGTLATGGLPGAYLAVAPQPYGRVDALIVVALAMVPAAATLLRVLFRMVRTAEPQVTPSGAERNDAGQPLLPPDEALKALLRRNLQQLGAADRPRREGPDGTRVSRVAADSRPMTVDDAGAYRAAPPQSAWEPEVDYYADGVREFDEQQARRSRPPADPGYRASHRLARG